MKLFIMFQGFGSTPSLWNEGGFLDRLKQNGKVYTYQNKLYNLGHYSKKIIKGEDSQELYPSDINFDISYFDMETHLQQIYNDIKHLSKYDWIPVGLSFGGLFALAFSKIYKKHCSYCVLLDPARFTTKNIKTHIKLTKKEIGNTKITNNKLQQLLLNIKNNNYSDRDIGYLSDTGAYHWMIWILKNITSKKLPIPVYDFIDINIDNSNDVLQEVSILKKDNNYNYRLFVDVGHIIYKNKKAMNIIINNIT